MNSSNDGLISEGLSAAQTYQKSPFIQGFLAAIKGSLLGAGAGTLVNAVRGKNPVSGAIIGGLGAGIISGLARAASQEVDNRNEEAALRYHLLRIGDREPTIYMPPPKVMGPLFRKLHMMAHRSDDPRRVPERE